MAHLKYGRTDKSSVAQHAFDNNHRIDINNLSFIRNITNNRQLDAFDSLEIVKCKNRMNSDNGPIPNSLLYWLVRQGPLNREHSHVHYPSFSINRISIYSTIVHHHKLLKRFTFIIDNYPISTPLSRQVTIIFSTLSHFGTVPYLSESHSIEILMMIAYGDKSRTQEEVVELFRQNQSTTSKIKRRFREVGNVGDTPRKISSKIKEDTKLYVLLAFEENPVTSARQVSRENSISHKSVVKLLKCANKRP
ncbi:hypothetical protein NQ317_016352 [Molorchus minor]|uniref:DUF4817 domain-containing protein n=1 Tax=Molorchus minor TaxID=1323400 RepID=A0ABQ9IY82_9CUCU|nr:hypothetical protein NQ317_016352 [Molorchus minor]